MEGHELLAKMTKVKAPPGFEEGVLAKLPAARIARERASRVGVRYALAGSAAVILIGFLLLSPSIFKEKGAILTYAERDALSAERSPITSRSRLVPVYETMDYASEFRNAQSQPKTVYILEQVSESVSSEVIY